MKKGIRGLSLVLVLAFISCIAKEKPIVKKEYKEPFKTKMKVGMEVATFAGGCFWCTEAIFLEIKGVVKVVSGYIGGTKKNPTYAEICTGTTGHAEAIQITFDPNEVAYEDLLEVFFGTHDPTTLNRQGADVGTQYRSEIFYHSEAQKDKADNYIQLLKKEKLYDKKIVTKVSSATEFYEAEKYHQNYYNDNSSQGYCQMVIAPKLEKLRKYYKTKLK
jgi:peptide-methionine (S)-S-oxide reductase